MVDQNKLRERVRRKVVTYDKIAKASGITNSQLSHWLKGLDVGLKTLTKIKEGLKQLKK